MMTINAQLSSGELEACYETVADPIAKSHFHALWLLSSGYEIEEVAELLSFSTRWVRSLINRYNAGGPKALGDQRVHNGTKPTILTRPDLPAGKRHHDGSDQQCEPRGGKRENGLQDQADEKELNDHA